MAIYWAGAGLLRKRAGLLATLALGTTPLFVLEARQLTSDAPLIAALALVLGAFGRYAWPPDGRRRPRDLLLGLVGLASASWPAARCRVSCCRSWRSPPRWWSDRGWSPSPPPPSTTGPARCPRQESVPT